MLMEKLKSRKLWALVFGLLVLFFSLPLDEAINKAMALIMVYMGSQGVADLAPIYSKKK